MVLNPIQGLPLDRVTWGSERLHGDFEKDTPKVMDEDWLFFFRSWTILLSIFYLPSLSTSFERNDWCATRRWFSGYKRDILQPVMILEQEKSKTCYRSVRVIVTERDRRRQWSLSYSYAVSPRDPSRRSSSKCIRTKSDTDQTFARIWRIQRHIFWGISSWLVPKRLKNGHRTSIMIQFERKWHGNSSLGSQSQ